MLYEFGRLRSPEVGEVMGEGALVVLPVGQQEEHGPHLPVNTDCVIGEKVAAEAARRVGKDLPVVLMDPIRYGYSGKLMTRWAGTMQVSMETIGNYVYEVCASLADMGAQKIAIFNNHGHHIAVLEMVARKLADEKGVAPMVLVPLYLAAEEVRSILKGGPGSSCHAGELETSLMLLFDPERVDVSLAKDDPVRDMGLGSGKGVFWSTWERQSTDAGFFGTPSVAGAETGKRIFELICAEAERLLRAYWGREGDRGIGFRV